MALCHITLYIHCIHCEVSSDDVDFVVRPSAEAHKKYDILNHYTLLSEK